MGEVEGKGKSMRLLLDFPCRVRFYAFSLSRDRPFLFSAILNLHILLSFFQPAY
jgi:hypothetical protein